MPVMETAGRAGGMDYFTISHPAATIAL
jgi:hypothetical protein